MAIDVRKILKDELPHTLSGFLNASNLPLNSMQSGVFWGEFDPSESDLVTAPTKPNLDFDDEQWMQHCPILSEEDLLPFEDGLIRPSDWDHFEIPEEDDLWQDNEMTIWGGPHDLPPRESSDPQPGSGIGGVYETQAYYMPFHIYDNWGIYVREEAVLRLQRTYIGIISNWIRQYARGYLLHPGQLMAIQKEATLLSFRLAVLRFYAHEFYHHKVESFATRGEIFRGHSVYLAGFFAEHRATMGGLEEGLAEAFTLKELSNTNRTVWKNFQEFMTQFTLGGMSQKGQRAALHRLTNQVVNYTKWQIYYCTPRAYRDGVKMVHNFSMWEETFRKSVLQKTGSNGAGLALATHLDSGYRRQDSQGFWIVVPKGALTPWWSQALGIL